MPQKTIHSLTAAGRVAFGSHIDMTWFDIFTFLDNYLAFHIWVPSNFRNGFQHMRLLHIDSSIQGENSTSRALSAHIVDQLTTARTDVEVTYRDLVATPYAHISLQALGQATTGQALKEFLAADVIVIGAPMYNLGLPSQLKAWIDQIVIAGKTFQYGTEGVVGLAGDKCVIVAHTRGGLYGAESPTASLEHAESHLRAILGFIGVANIDVIVAEGLALGDEAREAALASARARIASIGSADRTAA